MPRTSFLVVLLVVASLDAGCDTTSEAAEFAVAPGDIFIPEGERAARVDIAGRTVSGAGLPILDGPLFEGPVPVRAGVPFEVVTYTFGGLPTCTRPAESVVTVERDRATVAVRDSVYQGVCFLVLRYIDRVDTVTLTERGPAEVVVAGARPDGPDGRSRPHELRFAVVVE